MELCEPADHYAKPGGAAVTSTSSVVAVVMQRVDQRVEAAKRQLDNKLMRLDKRIEELARESTGTGRWAELQGYVDGLSETVQDLVRRLEPSGSNGITARPGDAMEPTDLGADRVTTARIEELERGTHRALASATALANRVNALERPLEHQRGALLESARLDLLPRDLQETLDSVHTQSSLHGTRLVALERALEQLGGLTPGCVPAQDRPTPVDEAQFGEFDARLQDVESGLQNMEQGLHDMWMDQRVKHQVNQVGEQLLRLGQLTHGDTNSADVLELQEINSADVSELQEELSQVNEQICQVQDRLHGAERGLDSMSRGFARVCAELAGLRGTSGLSNAAASGGEPAAACSHPAFPETSRYVGMAASGSSTGSDGAFPNLAPNNLQCLRNQALDGAAVCGETAAADVPTFAAADAATRVNRPVATATQQQRVAHDAANSASSLSKCTDSPRTATDSEVEIATDSRVPKPGAARPCSGSSPCTVPRLNIPGV
jgi:hypothetical protein